MYMDKIIKLAKKLDGLVSSENTKPQEIYDNLTLIMTKQREYFSILKPTSIVSLAICIYSYRKTGDFKLAGTILNHLFYASLVVTENQNHEEECDRCYGDGYESCDDCGGSGNQVCHVCDGNGDTECDECGGSGKVDYDEENDEDVTCDECGGKGEMTCPECDGDGEVTCNNCAGDGSFTCTDCDGQGTTETDMINYETYDICSWDINLENSCELNEKTDKPVVSLDGLMSNDDVIILWSQTDVHGNLERDLLDGELYCRSYQKNEPDLQVRYSSMRVEILLTTEEEEFYFT